MPAWQVCAEGQSPFAGLPQRNSTALVEFNRGQSLLAGLSHRLPIAFAGFRPAQRRRPNPCSAEGQHPNRHRPAGILLPGGSSAFAFFKRKEGEGGIENLASTDPVWFGLWNGLISVWFVGNLKAMRKPIRG